MFFFGLVSLLFEKLFSSFCKPIEVAEGLYSIDFVNNRKYIKDNVYHLEHNEDIHLVKV